MESQKITKEFILGIYQPVDSHAHKGSQGHALIIGGSYGKIGAACLSAKAALRSGCGLVTAFIPECGYQIMQAAIPEVMVLTDSINKHISDIQYDFIPAAIGIGPGMGQERLTQEAIGRFLRTNSIPTAIDADCLNILAKQKDWLLFLKAGTILTPHPNELERLIGKWSSEQQKLEMTVAFSTRYNVIIISKGAPTLIINGHKVYENTTGNAALATAGSGDVLTGIITSLLAQSYEPIKAAILAVYLHGISADIALPETGQESFIASDIISNIGKAFLALNKKRPAVGYK